MTSTKPRRSNRPELISQTALNKDGMCKTNLNGSKNYGLRYTRTFTSWWQHLATSLMFG
jgi:hypothetical protein